MHLLVTGIPACGKTTFARWLVANHGYIRCPQGEEPGPDFYADLSKALSANVNVVIDWGFPVQDLQKVESLLAAGTTGWWFDGDRSAALEAFKMREGHPGTVEDFQRQLGQIEQAWSSISAVFSDHVLEVIYPGPTFLSNDERWQRVRH